MSRKKKAASQKKPRGRKARTPNEPGVAEAAGVTRERMPAWAPYALFALLTLFLFREFVVSKGLLFGTDVAALGYFARHWYAEMLRSGTFPLWNPLIFGGLPFVDAMHGDIFYPTTLLSLIMPVHRAMGWKLVLHVFLAGAFTYHWLRHLGIGRPVATWGGVAYMLAPVLVSLVYPGHDGKLFVTAVTPLAFWITDWAITRGGLWRFATLSLVIALLMFTAHMQLAYYTTWGLLVLAIFRLFQARRAGERPARLAGRFAGFAMAGVVGGVLIAAVQIWTPLVYLTRHSQRVEKTIEAEAESAYTRATSWALHPEEAMSLVVPEFIGANLQSDKGAVNTYWGRNPFKLNHEYAGLIPLLLVPVALLIGRRRSEIWLFTGIAGATLIYALGDTTPLFRLYYWLVPGVKLFRAPSSIMFVFALAVVTVAALALQSAGPGGEGEKPEKNERKTLVYLWAATGFFVLLALLGSTGALTDLWVSIFYSSIDTAKAAALQANLANIQRGLWLTVLLSGALAAGWHFRARGKLPEVGWIAVLIALSAVDLLRVDPQFIQVVNPALIYPRDDTTEFLLRERENQEAFRVFSVSQGGPYQTNHFAFYGLEELTGHHGNELGRYLSLVDFQRLGAQDFRMLKLLNVRYLVTGGPLPPTPGLAEVFRGRRSLVYELQGAYPRAYLVSRYESVPDSLAIDRLLSPGFDPSVSVILEPGAEPPVDSLADGRVDWIERGVNQARLRVTTRRPALLVVADNYYPAWRARVDDQPAPVLQADYNLRAVPVPAGEHEVSIYFRSALFRRAVWTTTLSLVLVVGLIAVPLTKRLRANAVAEEADAAV